MLRLRSDRPVGPGAGRRRCAGAAGDSNTAPGRRLVAGLHDGRTCDQRADRARPGRAEAVLRPATCLQRQRSAAPGGVPATVPAAGLPRPPTGLRPVRFRPAADHERRRSGDEGLGALVSPFMLRLAAQAGVYGTAADRLGATAVDLLAALITRQLGQEDRTEPSAAALLARVHAYIAHHLGEPELYRRSRRPRSQHLRALPAPPLRVRTRQCLSGWIQQCRLEECRRALLRGTGPARPPSPPSPIGGASPTPAYFSRAFRARLRHVPTCIAFGQAGLRSANSGRRKELPRRNVPVARENVVTLLVSPRRQQRNYWLEVS